MRHHDGVPCSFTSRVVPSTHLPFDFLCFLGGLLCLRMRDSSPSSSALSRCSSADHHLRKSASIRRACSSSCISRRDRFSITPMVPCSCCMSWMATREAPGPVNVDCVVGCTGGRFQALPLVEGISQYDRRLLSLSRLKVHTRHVGLKMQSC